MSQDEASHGADDCEGGAMDGQVWPAAVWPVAEQSLLMDAS